MRIRQLALALVFIAVLLISPAMGDGSSRPSRAVRIGSSPELTLTCRAVSRAPKPFLEAVEDCVAYVLDIPLAMLSPLTCPIVAPILERFDSGPSRQYDRCTSR